MGLTKAARFSPQLLSQFPEVFSIAGNCSPKSALLPSSWPSLWCINSARQHTLLTLLSWSQILWGVKQVGPPAQASGRASLRCFATQKGQFKRRDYFPHSTLLKAVTNNFPDVDCFTHLSLSFFSSCASVPPLNHTPRVWFTTGLFIIYLPHVSSWWLILCTRERFRNVKFLWLT